MIKLKYWMFIFLGLSLICLFMFLITNNIGFTFMLGAFFGVFLAMWLFKQYGVVKYSDKFHWWNTSLKGYLKSEEKGKIEDKK